MLSLRNDAYLFCLSSIVGAGCKDISNKKGLSGVLDPQEKGKRQMLLTLECLTCVP